VLRRSNGSDVDEFVAARCEPLLRTAYLLAGDRTRAEDLLQAALAEVSATWNRSELGPELTARRTMVRASGQWRHRRRHDAAPPQEALAALLRLPRRQRAALVLHDLDGLELDEVATALDCSEAAAARLLARAHERFGGSAAPALADAAATFDEEPALLTVAQRLDDVQHRLDVRRAWRRTEVVASLFVATAAAITVVAVFPSADSGRSPSPPQQDMVEPPPLVAGHQLTPVLRVNDIDYEYFRSEEAAPGRPLLRVAVPRERQPQAIAWMSPPGSLGDVVVTVDGNRVARTRSGELDSGVLLSSRRTHLVTLTATRPDSAMRLGVAFYEWPSP
jgi:DNA-directed RNA polymerase specialized sigma24 family protein